MVVSGFKIMSVVLPQGSPLNTLLFIVNIKLSEVFILLRLNMRYFADDVCLSYQQIDPYYLDKVIYMEFAKVDKWLLLNKFVKAIVFL